MSLHSQERLSDSYWDFYDSISRLFHSKLLRISINNLWKILEQYYYAMIVRTRVSFVSLWREGNFSHLLDWNISWHEFSKTGRVLNMSSLRLQAVLYLSRSNKTFRVTVQLDFDVYLNGRPNAGCEPSPFALTTITYCFFRKWLLCIPHYVTLSFDILDSLPLKGFLIDIYPPAFFTCPFVSEMSYIFFDLHPIL